MASQAELAAIVASSSDAIIGTTLDGTVTSWNVGAERVFGFRESEVLGTSIHSLAPEDRQEQERLILAQVAAGEKVDPYENVRLHKSGHLIDVSVTVSPVRDEAGEIVGASRIARDISERKRAEAALRESEERFRATFESSAIGICHVSADGSWLRVNGKLRAITGYTEDEIQSTTFQDITHPDDLAADLAQAKRVLEGEIDSYSLEKRYLRKDGSYVWVRKTVSAVRKASGVFDYYNIAIEDISEIKAIGDRVKRQADLLDLSHDAIFVWKIGGAITYWSKGAERLYGWRPREAIGKTSPELLMTAPTIPMHEIEAIIAREGEWSGGLHRTARDGRKLMVESQLVRVSYEDGYYILETSRDVTARKHAEEALRQSEERLRLANEAANIGTFTVDLKTGRARYSSHLAVMLGFPGIKESDVEDAMLRVHREDVERVRGLYSAAIAGVDGGQVKMDFRFVRPGGEVRWMTWIGRVDFRETVAGREPFRIIGACLDITERKGQEEHIGVLMREIAHRSKNLLTLVQVIARRTAAASPEDFVRRFEERIRALAESQNLLVQNASQNVGLDGVVRSQLAHLNDPVGTRIRIEGPPVFLSASTAQGIAMAVHELSTNASKYGALSDDAGRVDIGWTADPNNGQFVLTWREMDGPPVKAPERKGFGSAVLTVLAEQALDAKAELNYDPAGLMWRLSCAASNLAR